MSKVLILKNEVKEAMKNKDKEKLIALRMLLSSLEKQKIVFKIETVENLTDMQVEDVVVKELKMLNQERESLVTANRSTEKVDNQIIVIDSYAPKYMTEDEVNIYLKNKIEDLGITGMKEKGKLMGVVSKELKGKADLGVVNKIIGALLN